MVCVYHVVCLIVSVSVHRVPDKITVLESNFDRDPSDSVRETSCQLTPEEFYHQACL